MSAITSPLSSLEESRIDTENAAADSLVSDEGVSHLEIGGELYKVQDLIDQGLVEYSEEPAEESQEEPPEDDLEGVATEEELEEAIGQEEGEQAPQEPAPQITLDEAVETFGLNDPQMAGELAADFFSALGTTPQDEGADIEAIGGTMAKAAVSAADLFYTTGGDLSKVPAIPPENAQQFSDELLSGLGLDPRITQHDAELLSANTLVGLYNILRTWEAQGRPTDLRKVNSVEQATRWTETLIKSLGGSGNVDKASALRIADAAAKYVIGQVKKMESPETKKAHARLIQSKRGKTQGSTGKGRTTPTRHPMVAKNMEDIFDGDVMDMVDNRIL